jgi:hypothetical protein
MSWACKIWQQKELQNTWKLRQIMVKAGFNLILNTKIKNKNTKYAKQKFKWKFDLITYENLNMKWNEQDYGARLYLGQCWIY